MSIWYIYGARGLGVETMDILCEMIADTPSFDVTPTFVTDDPTDGPIHGLPVISFEYVVPGSAVTIAAGEPATRMLLRKGPPKQASNYPA